MPVTLPNGASTTVDAALDPRNFGPVLRALGSRMGAPFLQSQQTLVAGQSRLWETLSTRGPANCIQLVYPNWIGNSGIGETSPVGPITISASVEVSSANTAGSSWSTSDGTIIPLQVTFNGAKYVTIPVDGVVPSDNVCFPYFAGQTVYVRTTYVATGGSAVTLPADHLIDTSKQEISQDGFYINTPLGASSTATITPSGTIDNTKSRPPYRPGSVIIVGGGITANTTDNGSGGFPVANGVLAGSTVNYSTGAISLNLTTATAPSAIAVAAQGDWGTALTDNTMTAGQLTSALGWASWNGHNTYGPAEVIGSFNPASLIKPRSVLIAGDSRLQGVGSTNNQYGWIERALNGQAGIIKLAVQGELANGCASLTAFRRRYNLMTVAVDRAYLNYGINDLASRTITQVEADETTCATRIAALLPRGAKDLYAVALEPRTVSSSNNTPFDGVSGPIYGNGTVASGSPSKRNAYNAWLYTQIGILWAGVLDTNAYVENSPATQAGAGDGTWKSLTYTKDGLHLNETGYGIVYPNFQGTPPLTIN